MQRKNAIRRNPQNVHNIKNLDEEECEIALKLDHSVFTLINNPSEKTCITALDHAMNSEYVKISTEKVIEKTLFNKKINIS